MKNKQNIILLLLGTLITLALLYLTIDTIIPNQYSSYSLPILSTIPFIILLAYLFRNHIWYLWILIPATFSFLPQFDITWGYLITFILTIPVYVWSNLLKRSQYTINFVSFIDIPAFILFAYIIHTALIHPIGLGLNFDGDYLMGHAYFSFLGCFIAYIFLSSLKIDSEQFYKILYISLFCLFFNRSFDVLLSFFSDNADSAIETSNNEKISFSTTKAYLPIATFTITILIIKYNIKDIITKIFPSISSIGSLAIIGLSGSRASGVYPVLLFFIVSLLYKRYLTIVISFIVAIFTILSVSIFDFSEHLPLSSQRILSIIPGAKIDNYAAASAQDSTDWRIEMWKYALDDRYNFIQDKVWGDGFSREKKHFMVSIYSKVYGLSSKARDTEASRTENTMYLDGWHSGPISTINSIGYIGFSLYIITAFIGIIYSIKVMLIFKNHKYRLPIIYYSITYFFLVYRFVAVVGVAASIPEQIYYLCIVKLIYNFAVKDKLYLPKSVRKEYIPMMCRQANSEPA